MRTSLALFLFSFTRVVSASARFLHCVSDVEGEGSYVASSPAISCDDSKYSSWVALAVIALIIYLGVGPVRLTYSPVNTSSRC